MTMHFTPGRRPALPRPHRSRGLSLVELMVALALGLVLVVGVASVYLFTKTAFSRQAQLSTLQQSVRTAFEYLGSDARMVGHMGCFTGSEIVGGTNYYNALSTTSLATNYGLGVEGFEFGGTGVGDGYTLGSDAPANINTSGSWSTNATPPPGAPSPTPNATMLTALTADRTPAGLTPGSDVLVIRTVARPPVRLTANTDSAGATLAIENISSGTCSNGTTAKVSGFCAGSHGVVTSCNAARIFAVTSIAGSALTLPAGAFLVFPQATGEVFPLQTIAYYIAGSSSGTTTSLYRRVFNGDPAAGVEQELIEDVETLQVRYGRDTTLPDPDGTVDDYVSANGVTSWSNVVTVRMSLLMRSATPLPSDTKVAASAPVNGVTVTFPGGSRYDRRVFTTTVALRNKIAYFQSP